MGDYAYLLEVHRELRRDTSFDSIPVQLVVGASKKQKDRFYKYFEETSELDIHWFFEEYDEQYAYRPPMQHIENASLVFFLSWWPYMKGSISPKWLNITEYADIADPGVDQYHFILRAIQRAKNYYQKANASFHSLSNLQRREGDDELKLVTRQSLIESFQMAGASCELFKQEFCSAPIRFGLGKKNVGMPFNSALSEKVDEFEETLEKDQTRMANVFKKLLKEKAWLGEALSGYKETSTQFESVRETATKNLRQSVILWVYLHRQHGCIPEYVLRHSCVGFKVEL
ncbi:MAG: hypothetical protein ACR2PX_13640 [Endozoicomonas sp.]|uniref:hypothetical protein n=1 Tax=Endozoicomonas sp. TaxID=1892382 RepID=UPI003D9ADDF9